MATYNPNQIKINPPPGGFKELGWYSGRQYVGGTLSEPGQIHPGSSQPGAGQAVSREVIAQTAPQNVAYIEQQRQQAALAPSPTIAQPAPAQPAQPVQPAQAGTTTGATAGITPQPTIDLQSLYNKLYSSPEMTVKQDKVTQAQAILSQREKEKIEAVGKINDNPFLSEATRVGRVAKLESLYNERTANLRKDIEMAAGDLAKGTADAEMQLNLQMKQFDINSQAAKTAFDQFGTLLSAGALSGASGDDIANITRGTGISGSMIQSAIDAQKTKNVKTEIIKWDDNINQGFAVINSNTGDIISKQTVAATATKPEKAKGISATETKEQEKTENIKGITTEIQAGKTLSDLIGYWSQVLSIDEIYRLYNMYTPGEKAKESLAQVKQGIFADQPGFKKESREG